MQNKTRNSAIVSNEVTKQESDLIRFAFFRRTF